MKNSYDYTKDEKYKSYEQFVYKSLIDLGFRVTNVGTLYLKDLILFAYFNNYYEICITRIVKDFMRFNKLNDLSWRTFINSINYAIKNCDNRLLTMNFQKKFKMEYSIFYLSIKNIVILLIYMINNQ